MHPHDPSQLAQMPPADMHAWPRPAAWRPPTSMAAPSARSTLPPLIADHVPPARAACPANGTHARPPNAAECRRPREVDSEGPCAGSASENPSAGHRAASLAAPPEASPALSSPPANGGGDAAAAADWSDDAMARSTLRIAKMTLGNDGAGAALDDAPDVAGMDLDELGWPGWPEAGSSGTGEGAEGAEGADDGDPVASAIADIFMRSSPQKRRTRNSISASFL
jgi:hypothetical protein